MRDIKHPKSSEENLKRYISTQENLTPQGTKSHNREQKEGTPGMPVTGHIIGDQPKRELGNIPKTLIIQKRAKSKLDYGMDIRFQKGVRILLEWGRTKGFNQRVHEIYYLLPSERG